MNIERRLWTLEWGHTSDNTVRLRCHEADVTIYQPAPVENFLMYEAMFKILTRHYGYRKGDVVMLPQARKVTRHNGIDDLATRPRPAFSYTARPPVYAELPLTFTTRPPVYSQMPITGTSQFLPPTCPICGAPGGNNGLHVEEAHGRAAFDRVFPGWRERHANQGIQSLHLADEAETKLPRKAEDPSDSGLISLILGLFHG